MWRKNSVIFFLFLLLAIGCGAAEPQVIRMSESSADFDTGDDFAMEEMETASDEGFASAFDSAPALGNLQDGEADEAGGTVERIILRSGEISIVVTDPEQTAADITNLAESRGGWVVSSDLRVTNSINNTKSGTVAIRIPAAQFTDIVTTIKDGAEEVRFENISGRDVTDEFVDLTARLDNLEATEARVQTFLDAADDVEDALAVNAQLSQLQGEIEVIKGRLKFLRESADFSSLTITLIPDSDAQPIEIAGWSPTGVAKDAIEFLIEGLQAIATLLIWFLIVGIPLLIILWIVVLIARRLRFLWPFETRRTGGGRSAD